MTQLVFRRNDIFDKNKVVKANMEFMYQDFHNAQANIKEGDYLSAAKEYASILDLARESREICLTEEKIPSEQKKCLDTVYADTKFIVETLEDEYIKKCGIVKQKTAEERIRHEFDEFDDNQSGLL